jgi:hypothetical protein
MIDTITKLKLEIGALTANIGIQTIENELSKLQKYPIIQSKITEACKKVGISINFLDINYQTLAWEDYEVVANILYKIVSSKKWTPDFYDCDNRANFMATLASRTGLLNTCADCYCEVKNINTGASDMHHPNLIIDKDYNLYLFDADQNGMYQRITSDNFVMGVWRYDLSSIRIY